MSVASVCKCQCVGTGGCKVALGVVCVCVRFLLAVQVWKCTGGEMCGFGDTRNQPQKVGKPNASTVRKIAREQCKTAVS